MKKIFRENVFIEFSAVLTIKSKRKNKVQKIKVTSAAEYHTYIYGIYSAANTSATIERERNASSEAGEEGQKRGTENVRIIVENKRNVF